MCGITALLKCDGKPVESTELRRLNDPITHRGPDGEGYWIDQAVGLAHRRLSIIDLEAGKQPLSNEDGTVWITFNGEIYNYRELTRELKQLGHTFRTASDTEVIVHAYEQWGHDCLRRLRGMFAFAIWDGLKQELFVARDRLGIKPLVYYHQPDVFAVGSEIAQLTRLEGFQGDLSLEALDMYLHYQYIPAPHTIYRSIKKLPPAHYLVVRRDGKTDGPCRYWDVSFVSDVRTSEAEWLERIDFALRDAVETHLVSDVPFGAFLSGGIDSSLVLAYMSRILKEPVSAFTIGHEVGSYDETPWARQAAERCGANHFVEIADVHSLELLPELVRHYGEPFADSSAIATYQVSKLARQHVKMVLSGDGGDELFAGYHAYPAILWQHDAPMAKWKKLKRDLADQARAMGVWPPRATPENDKYFRTAAIDPLSRLRLWLPEHLSVVEGTRADFDNRFSARKNESLLGRLQRFDVCNYIPFDNLNKVDIASMCHGLEVRVPLLDHVFVETAAQVPQSLKLRSRNDGSVAADGRLVPGSPVVGKYLLKRLASQFFSHDFIHREKRGFEVPIKHWFSGTYKEEFAERLAGPDSQLRQFFRGESLREFVQRGQEDRKGAWQAWSLLILDEFLRQTGSGRSHV